MADTVPLKPPRVGRNADSVSRVYAQVRQMAVDYDFKPEQRINEVELAARLNVSRTPVREALNRLVVEGLITLVPNKGFHCRRFDADQILNLFEVRAVLEVAAVRLACDRAGDKALADLKASWADVVGRSADLSPAELTEQDEAFHARIAALSANDELARVLKGIDPGIRFVRRIEIENPARRKTTLSEHGAIARALVKRDPVQAAKLMDEHIKQSVADAVAAMKEALSRLYLRSKSA